MNVKFGASCRSLFSIDPDLIFLNNGSFGAPPIIVLEKQAMFRAMAERSPISFFARDLPKLMRESANSVADFVDVSGDSIALVDNATTGVNSVVFSIAPFLKAGDILLTTSHVYGAVRQILQHYAALTGAEVVEAHVPFPLKDASEVVDAVASSLSSRVKFAVFDHITSPSGIIFPIQELVNLCKERDIPVLVDGAHAPGMVELQLKNLGADWYVGNCHKWLFAPKGCAFLYTDEKRLNTTHSTSISHGYGKGYVAEFDFTGTKDYSSFLSAPKAIQFYIENGGFSSIAVYNHNLAREMRRILAEKWDVEPPAPENMLGSLAALPLPAELPAIETAAKMLHDELYDNHKIEVPITMLGGRLWIRFSAQIFNEPSDYMPLASALPKAIEILSKSMMATQ